MHQHKMSSPMMLLLPVTLLLALGHTGRAAGAIAVDSRQHHSPAARNHYARRRATLWPPGDDEHDATAMLPFTVSPAEEQPTASNDDRWRGNHGHHRQQAAHRRSIARHGHPIAVDQQTTSANVVTHGPEQFSAGDTFDALVDSDNVRRIGQTTDGTSDSGDIVDDWSVAQYSLPFLRAPYASVVGPPSSSAAQRYGHHFAIGGHPSAFGQTDDVDDGYADHANHFDPANDETGDANDDDLDYPNDIRLVRVDSLDLRLNSAGKPTADDKDPDYHNGVRVVRIDQAQQAAAQGNFWNDNDDDHDANEPTDESMYDYQNDGSLTELKMRDYGTPEDVNRSRSLYMLSLNDHNMDVSEHARRIAKCKTPQPRIVHLSDMDPLKSYYPHCTLLHRCGDDTGCCGSTEKTCVAAHSDEVSLYFHVTLIGTHRSFVEVRRLTNHTQCHCVARNSSSAVSTVTAAPTAQIQRTTWPGNCTCVQHFDVHTNASDVQSEVCWCDCRPGNTECEKRSKGLKEIRIQDRRCISNLLCVVPKCMYGSYNGKLGRCPTFPEAIGQMTTAAPRRRRRIGFS